MKIGGKQLAAGAVILCSIAGSAMGQVGAIGPRPGVFPDVIVSGVGSGNTDLLYYGTSGGISAYALGSVSCNIATNAAWQGIWFDAGTFQNQHPVIGGSIYRLNEGRFEQIGMSWLKHGFCAADAGNCTNLAEPGTTVPLSHNGSCDWLGTGATDTYTAGLNGDQTDLGPRSEVNPWSGVYTYPYIRQWNTTGSCINKRLQVNKRDMDPSNVPNATFWGEVVYVMTDEHPAQRLNSYSYHQITRGSLLNASPTFDNICAAGSASLPDRQGYALSFTGATVPKKPAIEQWKVVDPEVKLVYVFAPNDGRFVVGSRVTNNNNGTWDYEYAVMNLNSHRGAGQIMIPKNASSAVVINNVGFYAPQSHSGEPFSNRPWNSSTSGSQIMWFTDSFASDPNANAIRWGTLYNFRYTANRAPTVGTMTIGLFKDAVVSGDADTVPVNGIDIPSNPPCIADFNGANGVSTQDLFDFLAAWFAGSPSADVNGANGISIQDIFDFLAAWFNGC